MKVKKIEELLTINMSEYVKWYYYVKRKESKEVIYHTYHGTKGLEFENVLIVLEDGFGTSREDKTFIQKFFEEYPELKAGKSLKEYEKARNLLYVAVTRARKNLEVMYTGDSEKVRQVVADIFS